MATLADRLNAAIRDYSQKVGFGTYTRWHWIAEAKELNGRTYFRHPRGHTWIYLTPDQVDMLTAKLDRQMKKSLGVGK